MIGNILNRRWLRKRRQAQMIEYDLIQDPNDPDKFTKTINGGYKMINGKGDIIKEVKEVTVCRYHWDGGNIVYDTMSKSTYTI